MQIEPYYYTILSALIFSIGILGIFLNRRSLIIILMSIELLLLELIFSFANYESLFKKPKNIINTSSLTNTHQIGKVMYTDYFFIFQLSGCILLVAMIGAIVLTLRRREGVLRQSIPKQLDRKKSESIKVIKIKKDENAN